MLNADIGRCAAQIVDAAVVVVLTDAGADIFGPREQFPGTPERVKSSTQVIEWRVDRCAKIRVRRTADLVAKLAIQGEVLAIGRSGMRELAEYRGCRKIGIVVSQYPQMIEASDWIPGDGVAQ